MFNQNVFRIQYPCHAAGKESALFIKWGERVKVRIALLAALISSPLWAAYPDDLQVSNWNVMLLPSSAFPNYAQNQRAKLIASADWLKTQDVVTFQELFDNEASELLLMQLKTQFPYQTSVLGRSQAGWDATQGTWRSGLPEDGGVAVVSKWPIIEKTQYLYNVAGCGDDFPALKGFVYVKINRNGEFYHLISTHMQSESSWGCNSNGGHAGIRQAQLKEIRQWIDQKNIPSNEIVVITGDFNINKLNQVEYQAMLATLQVNEPKYVGLPYTFDTKTNGLALERYGARTGDPVEYLDYILVDKSHRQPSVWQNLTIDPPSPQWTVSDNTKSRTYAYTDFSDHYPVMGFARADTATPTQSFVAQDGSHRSVAFQNIGNGRWVQSASNNDGWLLANASQNLTNKTRFNLSNNFSMRDNGCIRSGDYIRVERSDIPDWFWTWSGALNGSQYSYYTRQGALNASGDLRLINVSNPAGCLKDGDTVAFKDWARAADYFVTVWSGGSYDDSLFLWSNSVGPREEFKVQIPKQHSAVSWREQLIY
ncbi:sphingomyelin phosphodiesterase [Iodobacter sp. HSC-16F04]|uniref:Sphingomyelin phosphodiesterase n=1 Tax=Iodobacter violaceini TaxID=3044271 RepID=A0ABX0KUW1_9NEIS|nr:sphingomyelin phosphodiesterase [Iodobacter violacea]NHQ86473.1 sphingomyelin phosphodiesterase [Iodobacter violacea]